MKNEIQNNKLLIMGKLSATLAHEIRNPLSALKLNLNYLKMSEEEFDPEVIECLNSCVEAVERIQDLIENTLEFSRTPTKDEKETSINEISMQAVDILSGMAKKKNINIVSELDEKLPLLLVNRNKILQVFINLITNAIDASERNSSISLRSYQNSKKDVIFEVEDKGVGIKEEVKDKIFSDFYTNKKQGTGLGLSVCKKLLEEFESEISFKSEENIGTCFKIVFPQKLIK
ncbi:MAG: HAMP domain-containing histidine kinase [Melioribacteraceae bacterium]|nr:MAG: HAMP domain-containing histidine kinase [Melioribacteraceae bacterium]